MSWDYCTILVTELAAYQADGWEWVGAAPRYAHRSCIVRRPTS